MDSNAREIEFWGFDNDEFLTHTDKDEAIEDFLDTYEDTLPLEINVCGYARRYVRLNPKHILSTVLEMIDGNFGGEDEINQPEEEMLEITKKYAKEIEKIAVSFQCEKVTSEKINIRDWINTNRPDWVSSIGELK